MNIQQTMARQNRVFPVTPSGTRLYRRLAVGHCGDDQTASTIAPRPTSRRREGGMATVLFIALLAIMMVFVLVESQALIRLRREVRLLEQHQLKRLNSPQTNSVSTLAIP